MRKRIQSQLKLAVPLVQSWTDLVASYEPSPRFASLDLPGRANPATPPRAAASGASAEANPSDAVSAAALTTRQTQRRSHTALPKRRRPGARRSDLGECEDGDGEDGEGEEKSEAGASKLTQRGGRQKQQGVKANGRRVPKEEPSEPSEEGGRTGDNNASCIQPGEKQGQDSLTCRVKRKRPRQGSAVLPLDDKVDEEEAEPPSVSDPQRGVRGVSGLRPRVKQEEADEEEKDTETESQVQEELRHTENQLRQVDEVNQAALR